MPAFGDTCPGRTRRTIGDVTPRTLHRRLLRRENAIAAFEDLRRGAADARKPRVMPLPFGEIGGCAWHAESSPFVRACRWSGNDADELATIEADEASSSGVSGPRRYFSAGNRAGVSAREPVSGPTGSGYANLRHELAPWTCDFLENAGGEGGRQIAGEATQAPASGTRAAVARRDLDAGSLQHGLRGD